MGFSGKDVEVVERGRISPGWKSGGTPSCPQVQTCRAVRVFHRRVARSGFPGKGARVQTKGWGSHPCVYSSGHAHFSVYTTLFTNTSAVVAVDKFL